MRRKVRERNSRRSAGNSRNRRQRQICVHILFFVGVLIILNLIAIGIAYRLRTRETFVTAETVKETQQDKYIDTQPTLDVQLLDINKYSRPGKALEKVNGIVIHYTANPGTSAQQNWSYFNNLATTGETYASSHFIIGLEGEIIQCIPCNEISYASNDRNDDTLAIECCIEEESGKFNQATYDSLVQLVCWLMGEYDLDTGDVIRHYDITGKNCPKYFVEHPAAWDQFKEDLNTYIKKYGVEKGD